MGEVYVWSEMDAGNWEAPRGKGKFDIETGWTQKVVERYATTYLSSPLSSSFALFILSCFILNETLRTLGETKRNLKEFLIRNLQKTLNETLKKP